MAHYPTKMYLCTAKVGGRVGPCTSARIIKFEDVELHKNARASKNSFSKTDSWVHTIVWETATGAWWCVESVGRWVE